jgi:hypothetical protein
MAADHKRLLLHPGRRGGKTHVLDGLAFRAAERFPGCDIPVVQRTLSCAAATEFWDTLQELDVTHKMGVKFQHTVKCATFPNKSRIQLWGCDTAEAADKIRGCKTPLAIVDECGAYRPAILKYLVEDVLEACTIDMDGTIALAGTPNPLMSGFFYEASVNPEWQSFHWTLLDNPHIAPEALRGDPAAARAWCEDWLSKYLKRTGMTRESSKFIREYMGRWTETFDDRMYELGGHNLIAGMPGGDTEWNYFLGADVGVTDPCAFTVWARRDDDPNLYVVESYEQPKLIPSTFAAHVSRLQARFPFTRMVIDAGGLGKAFQQELQQTYGITMDNADKQGKVAAIDAINGDLVNGRIKIVSGTNQKLLEDMRGLPWNEARTDAMKGRPDHTCDSFLYGGRLVRQWGEAEWGEAEGPKVGSKAWWKLQEAAMEAEAEESARNRGREPDDDGEPDLSEPDWLDW